jgi:UDP-N-acetylglucosamine--N-acetylmuramyl-(pentapeptide) pyrophosphoryl-undecaprenol N-acetylglucosamine transferase
MSRHLVIMAAGTGGHIIPGLAVAEEMKRRGWSVSWMGTELGMENKLVPVTGIPLDRLAFAGLRGKGLMHSLTGMFKLVQAFVQSRQVFVTRSADAVLGMGGYVCFPGGLMAWLMRRRCAKKSRRWRHRPNALPGAAGR